MDVLGWELMQIFEGRGEICSILGGADPACRFA
jgi:hypothetical protein